MDDYIETRELGRGAYGCVALVEHTETKKQFVQKRIDLKRCSPKVKKSAGLEVKLLSVLRHPNIVRYRDSQEIGDALYILMEYCENGDLHTRIKNQDGEYFSEDQTLHWFVQICMALQVGDFGIARILESNTDMATTLIGTPVYMSPELLTSKPYNSKSDIWSLGCCLVELCSLKVAFNAKDMVTLIDKVLKGKVTPLPPIYSPEVSKLTKACLHAKPEKRPSTEKILRHPFIRTHVMGFLKSTSSILQRADVAGRMARGRSESCLTETNGTSTGLPSLASTRRSADDATEPDINQNDRPASRKKKMLSFASTRESSVESFTSDTGRERASSAPHRSPLAKLRSRKERNAKSAMAATSSDERRPSLDILEYHGDPQHNTDLAGLVLELNKTLLLDSRVYQVKKKSKSKQQLSPRQVQLAMVEKECDTGLTPGVKEEALGLMKQLKGDQLEIALLDLLGDQFSNFAPLLIQLRALRR